MWVHAAYPAFARRMTALSAWRRALEEEHAEMTRLKALNAVKAARVAAAGAKDLQERRRRAQAENAAMRVEDAASRAREISDEDARVAAELLHEAAFSPFQPYFEDGPVDATTTTVLPFRPTTALVLVHGSASRLSSRTPSRASTSRGMVTVRSMGTARWPASPDGGRGGDGGGVAAADGRGASLSRTGSRAGVATPSFRGGALALGATAGAGTAAAHARAAASPGDGLSGSPGGASRRVLQLANAARTPAREVAPSPARPIDVDAATPRSEGGVAPADHAAAGSAGSGPRTSTAMRTTTASPAARAATGAPPRSAGLFGEAQVARALGPAISFPQYAAGMSEEFRARMGMPTLSGHGSRVVDVVRSASHRPLDIARAAELVGAAEATPYAAAAAPHVTVSGDASGSSLSPSRRLDVTADGWPVMHPGIMAPSASAPALFGGTADAGSMRPRSKSPSRRAGAGAVAARSPGTVAVLWQQPEHVTPPADDEGAPAALVLPFSGLAGRPHGTRISAARARLNALARAEGVVQGSGARSSASLVDAGGAPLASAMPHVSGRHSAAGKLSALPIAFSVVARPSAADSGSTASTGTAGASAASAGSVAMVDWAPMSRAGFRVVGPHASVTVAAGGGGSRAGSVSGSVAGVAAWPHDSAGYATAPDGKRMLQT